MGGYLLRRLAATLPVMAVVAVVVFLLIHLSPGDPAALIAGDLATTEDIARLRVALGLDRPLGWQFLLWAGRILSGDLGTSIFTNLPVTQLLAQRLEPTLSIAFVTMAIALLLSIPLGTLAAARAGSWIDRVVMVFAVLAFSLPVFLVGYLLIYGFAIQLDWFPVQGYVRLAEGGVSGWLRSLTLPCVNLALLYMALLTRMTRATVLEVLQEDYIRTARAKGLNERRTLAVHAFKNASLPIVTLIGLDLPFLLAGAVVTETIFAWPGMGRLFIDHLSRSDFPVLMGLLMLISVAVVLFQLLTDVVYTWLDPRIRFS